MIRTVDFNVILFEALQLAGQDRSNIQPSTFAQFRDFANSRMRFMWDAFEWIEAVRVQEVTTAAQSDSTVYFVPPAGAEELLRVFVGNPLVSPNVKEVSFTIYVKEAGTAPNIYPERRVALPSGFSASDSLYLVYKIEKPTFFGDIYSSTQAYSTNSQVYFDIDGNRGSASPAPGKRCKANFYTALEDTTIGQSPFTHPELWKMVEIPYFAASYLPRALHADWLRSEMQIELARMVESDAEYALTEEIGKVTKTQGQAQRLNMTNIY